MKPDSLEELDAYQSAVMPDAEAEAFEAALFDAAANGGASAADFVDRISRIGQFLQSRGTLDFGSSRAKVDQLIARGFRVQFLTPSDSDPSLLPRVEDDAELVVTHVPIDVRGYDRVDAIIQKPDGTELKTFSEVEWDPQDGTLYALCEAPLARISMQQKHLVTRLIGRKNGVEHLIAMFETRSA